MKRRCGRRSRLFRGSLPPPCSHRLSWLHPVRGDGQAHSFLADSSHVSGTNGQDVHTLALFCMSFRRSVMSDALRPHETAARQPSLSFTVSQSLSKFISVASVMLSNHLIPCHPPFAFSLYQRQSLPTSPLFTSGGQSIGASVSVLPVNIQD